MQVKVNNAIFRVARDYPVDKSKLVSRLEAYQRKKESNSIQIARNAQKRAQRNVRLHRTNAEDERSGILNEIAQN